MEDVVKERPILHVAPSSIISCFYDAKQVLEYYFVFLWSTIKFVACFFTQGCLMGPNIYGVSGITKVLNLKMTNYGTLLDIKELHIPI